MNYIYMTINLINGKKYIGKHKGELNDSYLGSGILLLRAIKKYGKENFKKEILYISKDEKENSIKEKEFIKKYNAVNREDFYNIHEGGNGGNTIAGWTEEQKIAYSKKISEKYAGEKNPRYGIHLTEETKEKIRKNRDTSYMKTEEYRKKMSMAVSGEKNGMYGKKGDKAINGKKIAMYDEKHNLIRIFNAKTAVLSFLGLKGHTQLDRAIKEGTLYKGYYWKNYISVETKV